MSGDISFTMMHILTFVTGAAVALLLALAGQAVASSRRTRERDGKAATSEEKSGMVGDAWSDPETGQCGRGASSGKIGGGLAVPLPLATQQLFETMRGLLGDEISKSLAHIELFERLDRLEAQAKAAECFAQADLRSAALAEAEGLRAAVSTSMDNAEAKGAFKVTLRSQTSAETRTPNSSDRSGGSTLPEEDSKDLPGAIAAADSVAPVAPPLPSKEIPLPPPMPALRGDENPSYLEFGPATRQRRHPDSAEKNSHGIAAENALQTSLTTVQKALGKRDAQTTELHRQLREVRQSVWLHIQEARVANAQLHGFLADPSRAPKGQAEALRRLQEEAKELSGCLAGSRAQEQQWATLAQRQKAFFMQNERVGKEPGDFLKHHPAGDIFLAPPRAIFDEDEQPSQEPMWDNATSHCNSYLVDSWPFEPNGLTQRASQEPGFRECEDSEDEDNDDDEDEEQIDLRRGWSEDDEEDDSQESQNGR